MSVKIDWKGPEAVSQIESRLVAAVDEIDLRIEGASKEELYPGHGLKTGNLRRDIHAGEVRVESSRIVGSVGAGVKYALKIHTLYEYFYRAVERVRPMVMDIISSKVKK